jgi:hypothetical protein
MDSNTHSTSPSTKAPAGFSALVAELQELATKTGTGWLRAPGPNGSIGCGG